MKKKSTQIFEKDEEERYLERENRDAYIKRQLSYFIKEVLKDVPKENDFSYIDTKLGEAANSIGLEKNAPGYQIRPALQEMLDKKVSRESIMDVIRVTYSDAINSLLLVIEGQFLTKGNWGFYFEKQEEPIHRIGEFELSNEFDFPEFLPRGEKKNEIKKYKESQEKIKKRLQKKGLIKK